MTKEKLFWDWFRNNEAKYFFLNQIDDDNEREQLLDDFLYHLHQYCDQLFFEIGGTPNEKQELIITAEGNIAFFEKIEALVKEAPELEHWNIIAFKPVKINFITEYNDIRLDPKMLYFIPLNNKKSNQIGLRVYIDDDVSANKTDFLTATYLVLDNLIGERSNALNIGYIEVESLPPISEREGLIELTRLTKYIAFSKAKES